MSGHAQWQHQTWDAAFHWAQVFARQDRCRWEVWRDRPGVWLATPKPVRL